jgi:hypothetical protein
MMSETMKTSSAKVLMPTSDILMESFLHSTTANNCSAREAWFARQTTLSLMRLVRSEQLLAIKQSVRKLVPEAASPSAAKSTKPKRGTRKQSGQTHLVFGREA